MISAKLTMMINLTLKITDIKFIWVIPEDLRLGHAYLATKTKTEHA